MAILLKAALDRNGLSYKNIGNTYHADHAQVNGKVAESALDHVYSNMEDIITKIIPNNSSDHNPVVTYINLQEKKICYVKKLTKRSFKNFTTERWNESLKNQNWDPVINEQDLDVKVSMFTEIINKALDDVAPLKTFIVKSHYKFGISEEIKLIMKKEILNVYNSTG